MVPRPPSARLKSLADTLGHSAATDARNLPSASASRVAIYAWRWRTSRGWGVSVPSSAEEGVGGCWV